MRAAALIAIVVGVGACTSAPPSPRPALPAGPPSAPSGTVPGAGSSAPATPIPAPDTAPAPAAPPNVPTGATPFAAPNGYTPSSDSIALVLPLDSPTYGRAADAVRAGFLAAAERAGAESRIRVIGHGDDGVLGAFAAATTAGVALVVGPLTRDDLKTVIALSLARPRMLALNQLDDSAPLPPQVYSLTLAIDQDAAQLVQIARSNGVQTIAIVASGAPLQRRFAVAFSTAWQKAGNDPPKEYHYDSNPDALAQLRQAVTIQAPDAVLLAVDASDAALARSFLPPGKVYASSQIADGLPEPMLRDLEGVRYLEVPWVADPTARAFADIPRSDLGGPVLDRLYAMGVDAFALAQLLAQSKPPQRIEMDGATGHLSLTQEQSFTRVGRLMSIHDGRAQTDPPAQ